ncbi:aspartyl/glutamyl-tRNA amidotransferase subunit A [Patescibacteria group bacterium]|nr:aspartyl/glutamyl-tRNA amidotransferase subunit A [Patescibacteria group bacterium]
MGLNQLNLSQALNGLKEKKFTSVDLVKECVARINQVDDRVRAFLARNSRVETEAMELPVGIPVAIKDNFNTVGLETTASSKILCGYIPPYDATVVRKVRENSGVILGKTNMDAFAHGSSTETSDFGSTKNPWNLTHLPGGSSGGSAAAVAADETIYALGSETAGSIRQPAAWCGVVGLKPTYGRVSRYGLIAMCSSTDSPGPITKTVGDARIVYNWIRGVDPMDATTKDGDSGGSKGIKGLKIGLPKEYFRAEAQKGINETVRAAARELEKLGAKLVDISMFDPRYAISDYTIVQRAEVSSNLERFDGVRFGRDRSFFNEENKRRIMLGTYTLSAGYYDAYYKKAQQVRTLIVDDFEKTFEKVDLILAPTSPSVALKVGASKGQSMFGELADILVEPSSLAGLPGISVPCGFVNGLPVGMQLIGSMWSEELILNIAEEFERVTNWHKEKPKL